jgi:hypothetical protein
VRFAVTLLCSLSAFGSLPAFAQSLESSEFRLAYTSDGVTSLMRVNDKYATNYVARGRALGDVLIRYRLAQEKVWRRASAAMKPQDARDGKSISFSVGELLPTLSARSSASSSIGTPAVQALADELLPLNSHDAEAPRFVWLGRKGTAEWVEYDFPEPKEVHSIQLYWALSDDQDVPVSRIPVSSRTVEVRIFRTESGG